MNRGMARNHSTLVSSSFPSDTNAASYDRYPQLTVISHVAYSIARATFTDRKQSIFDSKNDFLLNLVKYVNKFEIDLLSSGNQNNFFLNLRLNSGNILKCNTFPNSTKQISNYFSKDPRDKIVMLISKFKIFDLNLVWKFPMLSCKLPFVVVKRLILFFISLETWLGKTSDFLHHKRRICRFLMDNSLTLALKFC